MTKEERKKLKKEEKKLYALRKMNVSNHISAVLGTSPFAIYNFSVEWDNVSLQFKSDLINEYQEEITVNPKAVDEKTYFALVGIAHSYDFEFSDYEFDNRE